MAMLLPTCCASQYFLSTNGRSMACMLCYADNPHTLWIHNIMQESGRLMGVCIGLRIAQNPRAASGCWGCMKNGKLMEDRMGLR